jgi:hypothetical protein
MKGEREERKGKKDKHTVVYKFQQCCLPLPAILTRRQDGIDPLSPLLARVGVQIHHRTQHGATGAEIGPDPLDGKAAGIAEPIPHAAGGEDRRTS